MNFISNLKYVVFLTISLSASASYALTCNFETECVESENCAEGAFTLDIDFTLHEVSTDFGDLDVVAISRSPSLLTMPANGEGANYFLTKTDGGARLSVHMEDGPMMINYLGTCQ